jgi:hypothetical protein
MDADELAARLSALGGFFVIDPPDRLTGGDVAYRPLAELVGDPQALRRRSEGMAARLAVSAGRPVEEIDARAAASAMHLGLAARLISPVIAAAALAGAVPSLDPVRARWREPGPGEAVLGLALPGPDSALGPDPSLDGIVDAVRNLALAPALLPLEAAVRAGCGVPAAVLAGNTVSAAAGAVTVLTGADPAAGRRGRALVAALLRTPELAGRGGWTAQGTFRRASCCLWYRLPGGGLCGDCVLVDSPLRTGPRRPPRPR